MGDPRHVTSGITRADRYRHFLGALLAALDRVRAHGPGGIGLIDPSHFLVDDTDPSFFWELIGVRVRGHRSTLIGAARFRRQSHRGTTYGRRSLSCYLSQPPKNLAIDQSVFPAQMLQLQFAGGDESFPSFLRRLTAGERRRTFLVDVETVVVAFDFRNENPSLEKGLHPQRTSSPRLLIRTVDDHILSAVSHGLSNQLHSDRKFLGLTDVRQHTARRSYPLPTLIVNRSYLSSLALPGPGEEVESWLTEAGPFQLETANPQYLLDCRA